MKILKGEDDWLDGVLKDELGLAKREQTGKEKGGRKQKEVSR